MQVLGIFSTRSGPPSMLNSMMAPFFKQRRVVLLGLLVTERQLSWLRAFGADTGSAGSHPARKRRVNNPLWPSRDSRAPRTLAPEVCPTCGKDGYEVMLCFVCDHSPDHCICDGGQSRFSTAVKGRE